MTDRPPGAASAGPPARLSLPKGNIRILLLEGVHKSAIERLKAAGYSNVEALSEALDEAALTERIAQAHVVGIRSRTQLTGSVLAAARRLFCIGCFCIGTNQVDLTTARAAGIPVFNAPYSNTRSVAEMVIGEIVMLLRGITRKSALAHAGRWDKTAKNAFELRGKVLGIVGYGHIGSQLSVLAEAMGMQVRYFDIEPKMALGNAMPCTSLGELLSAAQIVTLHVPETPATRGMIGPAEIRAMPEGSYLINASRGTVVDIDALAAALRDRHLAGAAIDVFPREPATNDDPFESPLQGLDNTILTPHVGGSTQEAQLNIGLEVAEKMIKYSDNGSTVGAVNFPEVSLPVKDRGVRFLHIHRNVPGVLLQMNDVFSSRGLNIAAQYLQTDGDIGYVVVDAEGAMDPPAILEALRHIAGTIRARHLY
ncbi:MAG: phosphoglycerate dehydrogenase [Alphaproteobacteria bacterium]|nr:phosphoglycerate dehydrogenase [Alphaproteobacteria bacterium]